MCTARGAHNFPRKHNGGAHTHTYTHKYTLMQCERARGWGGDSAHRRNCNDVVIAAQESGGNECQIVSEENKCKGANGSARDRGGGEEATALGGAHKLVFLVSTPSVLSTNALPTVYSHCTCVITSAVKAMRQQAKAFEKTPTRSSLPYSGNC